MIMCIPSRFVGGLIGFMAAEETGENLEIEYKNSKNVQDESD